MLAYYKLPLVFDAQRMLTEVEALEQDRVWLSHPDYTVATVGDWAAIALISTDGDHTGPESLRYRGGAKSLPTQLLLKSPYLRQVTESFKTDIHRARLMNLKPGTVIREHRDYGAQRYSVERGYVRVHIPVRTHPLVYWKSSGVVVPMRAGEAWYTNVCQPHSVENRSTVNRVHLVLDMKVNEWFLSLLPERTWQDKLASVLVPTFEPAALTLKTAGTQTLLGARRVLGDMGLRWVRDRVREVVRKRTHAPHSH